MYRSREYLRLCRLIDDSLHPSTDSDVVPLTKDKEKNVLLVLSHVLREIQLLTHELDCNSENDTEVKPDCNSKCSAGSNSDCEDDCCLAKIIADFIVLLTVESQYVQHLACNVLVVISEFMAASGSIWNRFIHVLCVCLQLAISNTLSYSFEPSITGAEISISDSSSFIIVLKSKLKIANWSTVAGITRVLRNILKYLKKDYDDQLVQAYLDSVSSCISNVPWDLLSEIHIGQNADIQRSTFNNALLHRNVWRPESRTVFLGNLVQLFCSLVEQSGSVEAAGGSLDKHQILCKISNLTPGLLYWCLSKQGDCTNTCISQYFRHKLLMLMIRLSSLIRLGYSILISWLQLIHKYFQDLLCQPVTRLESGQDDCLEGSPFLLSVSDGEVHSICSRHLQRQAVFLFLRCSFSLISLGEDADEHCSCGTRKSCLAINSSFGLECCNRKKGFSELYEWLKGHLPTDMFVDYEMYLEKCINFSLSFLQLFMHEDDILFEVLLQLFSVPFCAKQQCSIEKGTFQELKEDILFHVSNLFNPIHLFHLFLAELHYDHQVLLDYLISKDTGISCAEYLLRCLRTVCDSWHLFVKFSMGGKVLKQPSCKKRKVLLDGPNSQVEQSSVPDKGNALSLEEVCDRDHNYGCEHYGSRGQPFKEAKGCLLSLKSSVESLHQKNLFPYNPEVLLRRLMRFQDLCLKQEKDYHSKNGGTD